jgi:hypothetical protein
MPYFHLIDYIPWIGSVIAELIVVGIMLRRDHVRRFPIFLTWIVFDLLRELTLPVVAYNSAKGYLYSYWLSIPIEYVIAFAVILEAVRHSLVGESKTPAKDVRLGLLAALVLVGLAAFLVLHPDISTSNWNGLVLMLDRSIELLRCGTLLLLWTFASKLGISWRHHVWGIVFGLGLYSAMGLIVVGIHATTGIVSGDWLARVPHFSYLAAVIIWAVYLWRPEPARGPLTLKELSLINYLLGSYRRMLAELWRLFLDGTTN